MLIIQRLIRLLGQPRRLFFVLSFKIKRQWVPLECIPSYEHKPLFLGSINPGLVLDIGFNVGQFSVLSLHYFTCPVIAFDPNPYASPKAAAKIQRHFPQRFRFFPLGIGSISSSLPLNIARTHSNSSFLQSTLLNQSLYRATEIIDSIEAAIMPLSAFCLSSYHDILLKIDVQGYELNVLQGISDSQYRFVRWIYIELSDLVLYESQASYSELKEFLLSLGYRLHSTHNIFRAKSDSHKILYCDALFERV